MGQRIRRRSPERVLDELKSQRGRHFDPRVVDCLLDNLDGALAILDRYPDVEARVQRPAPVAAVA